MKYYSEEQIRAVLEEGPSFEGVDEFLSALGKPAGAITPEEERKLEDYALNIVNIEILSWNGEQSEAHRAKRLHDWIDRHGAGKSVNECLAVDSWEMAEAMLSEYKKRFSND